MSKKRNFLCNRLQARAVAKEKKRQDSRLTPFSTAKHLIRLLLVHLTVYHFKAQIELLAGAFPSVMRPKPVLGMAVDGLFEHTEVDVCYFKLGHFLRLIGNELELGFVMSARGSGQVEIEYYVVGLTGDALRTAEHRRVVMQKVAPVMYVPPERHLIADVSNHHGAVLTLVADYLAQRFLHGDANGTEALAQLQIEFVEHFVLQRMVNLSALCLVGYPKGQRGDEFPVAIVAEINRT